MFLLSALFFMRRAITWALKRLYYDTGPCWLKSFTFFLSFIYLFSCCHTHFSKSTVSETNNQTVYLNYVYPTKLYPQKLFFFACMNACLKRISSDPHESTSLFLLLLLLDMSYMSLWHLLWNYMYETVLT